MRLFYYRLSENFSSPAYKSLTVTEDVQDRLLFFSTEPTVRVVRPSRIVFVVIDLGVSCDDAHQGFYLLSIQLEHPLWPLLELVFPDEGPGLSASFCLNPRLLIQFFILSIQVGPDLRVGDAYRWFRSHQRFPCPQPRQIVSYLVSPYSLMTGNPENFDATLFSKPVSQVVTFQNLFGFCGVAL